jgi:hypothetical protein
MDEAVYGNNFLCDATGRMDRLIILLRRYYEEMLFKSANLNLSDSPAARVRNFGAEWRYSEWHG